MTLRYACADLEHVTKEYFAALVKTKDRYNYALPATPQTDGQDTANAIDDIARKIHRDAGDRTGASRDRSHRLARELRRIAKELQELGL